MVKLKNKVIPLNKELLNKYSSKEEIFDKEKVNLKL